jgi:hypothetical protein
MCKKIKQRLGVLKQVRKYLDQDTTTLLFNAMILPIADYCDTVYGTCGKTLLSKVNRLLCKGGRIILNVPLDTPSRTVLQDLKWMTLTERIFLHRCIMMYKSINLELPDYINRHFKRIDHGYNT